MSTQPTGLAQPLHPLTVAEYLELGEPEIGYTELVEGRLLMSPSPAKRHSRANSRLWAAIDAQLPQHLAAFEDIDLDLQLAPPDAPGTVRRPDLIVVTAEADRRIDDEGGVFRAPEVVLAVEIISPSSKRIDHLTKRGEYADAGIPHYWIIDLSRPVSLLACHLAGEFGYVDGGDMSGRFTTTEPFPFEIDLDSLL